LIFISIGLPAILVDIKKKPAREDWQVFIPGEKQG
jgi:hypothetical protein